MGIHVDDGSCLVARDRLLASRGYLTQLPRKNSLLLTQSNLEAADICCLWGRRW